MDQKKSMFKIKGGKKKVTFTIREEIMSREFVILSIRSLFKNNPDYKKGMAFKSPLEDIMILTVLKGDKEIAVSAGGRSDITLSLKGDQELVKEFVHDMTTEALTLVASEFSLCLQKTAPWLSQEKLRTEFRKHLKEAIYDSIMACKKDILEMMDHLDHLE